MGETTQNKTFVVGMFHDHNGEVSRSFGRLQAADEDEALMRSELWMARKKRDCGCAASGHQCEAFVFEAYTSRKTAELAYAAEEVFPGESAAE